MSDKNKKSGIGPGGFGRGGHRLAGPPTVKAKDFKGTLKTLLSYLKPYTLKLVIVLLTAILSTLFAIISPLVMGKATTKLFEGFMNKSIDFAYIANIAVILVVLYVFSALFGFIQQYVMANVAQKTVYGMRNQITAKLSRLPLKYFDSNSHGDVLSRVTNDIDTISSTLQQTITQLITSSITLIGVIVMMLSISVSLTIVTLVVLPLSIFFVKMVTKRSQKYFIGQQKEIGKLNGHIEEMYTGHQIIKAFGHEERSIKDFNEINEKLYDVGWKAIFISGILMPLMNFVNNIGYILVCVVGGYLVIAKAMTVGNIQAFIQYSRQFGQPIVQVANIANIIQSTVAAAERVFEVLDAKEEVSDADNNTVLNNPHGQVDFNNVSFGYDENKIIIHNMNLNVAKGQLIAIVGPTGAGKTTLVNLLMRFYDTTSGKIMIDGKDITSLKRKNLRDIFGMVLQDTWLFNGSIKDNIAYGSTDASEDEIINAAKLAHADHFIRTLPDGYDTILNEEASNISQGQKQLLTIARAILADPTILILDEATSSVDTRTEIHIQNAMESLMKNRTSFVIAHRLSTIKDADVILVMKEGNVIEQGTHEELLNMNGFYADLYNSQFNTQIAN